MAEFLKSNLILVLCAVLSLIEVAPIKINPFGRLAKWWGKHANGDVLARLDGLEKRTKRLEEQNEEGKIITARTRILRFGDECQCGQLHSREHWDQIIADITLYEHYCDNHHDFQNGKTVGTIKYLNEKYQAHMSQGDWL